MITNRRVLPGTLVLAGLLAGCMVGPNYRRPPVPVPSNYRGQPAAGSADSLGDVKWAEMFGDDKLKELIRLALQDNYDVRIAAARVLEARAAIDVTRSPFFPQVNGSASSSRQGGSGAGITQDRVLTAAGWNLDIWGRVRRALEAANADLLAADYVGREVQQSLVAQVATQYFVLRDLDQKLEISRRSLENRQASLRLVEARLKGGVSSRVDFDQASSLVSQAEVTTTNLKLSIVQTENLISILTGRDPSDVERGLALNAQRPLAVVPAGLPSTLLTRRPDIIEAEQKLIAQNARIGVAKAAFFPSITLTGAVGTQHFAVGNFLNSSGLLVSHGAEIDLPIFNAGSRAGNYRAAKARQQQALLSYQKTILNAVRDVSDSLAAYRAAQERRIQQERLAGTLRDQLQLSTSRYRGGVTSYLEVLDTERQSLTADLSFSEAARDELISVVQLYRSLGGGWEKP